MVLAKIIVKHEHSSGVRMHLLVYCNTVHQVTDVLRKNAEFSVGRNIYFPSEVQATCKASSKAKVMTGHFEYIVCVLLSCVVLHYN